MAPSGVLIQIACPRQSAQYVMAILVPSPSSKTKAPRPRWKAASTISLGLPVGVAHT
jgi:hypothetical protein